MIEPARRYPAAADDIRPAPVPDAGANVSADIAELIMADHRRIGRLCRAVYDTARHGGQPGPDWMLGHVWQRLADLLVAHTQAEEQTCYASLVSGAGPQLAGRMRDPVADHEDIRALIGEASVHTVGSVPWWHAVRTVIEVSTDHHEREERDILPACVLGLGLDRRKELGRQWYAAMAAWRRDPHPGTGPAHRLAGTNCAAIRLMSLARVGSAAMVTKKGQGRVTAALFDVDGTLVDTNYLHAVTWWEAFAQAGHVVPAAEIHRAIGMGSGLMLDKLLPADRDKDADADIRAAHSALYATYRTRLRPLPGAAGLLRACKRQGLAVVLASSADEPEFTMLREALDAEDAIDAATFSGDVESSKPAPDLVEVALDKAGVPAEQAVFTGDTVWDVEACQKAGVACIGLLSGGVSRDELTSAGAAEVYPGPGDLLAALGDSLLGAAGGTGT